VGAGRDPAAFVVILKKISRESGKKVKYRALLKVILLKLFRTTVSHNSSKQNAALYLDAPVRGVMEKHIGTRSKQSLY